MKEKMKNIINSFHKYNSENMAYLAFGLDNSIVYDVLVVAPSYTPYKFKLEDTCQVTTLKEGSYIAGYLVEKDDLKIAWVKFGSSDSNLIDHVAVCAELKYKKMVFIGAVGALKAEFELGEICTPSYVYSYRVGISSLVYRFRGVQPGQPGDVTGGSDSIDRHKIQRDAFDHGDDTVHPCKKGQVVRFRACDSIYYIQRGFDFHRDSFQHGRVKHACARPARVSAVHRGRSLQRFAYLYAVPQLQQAVVRDNTYRFYVACVYIRPCYAVYSRKRLFKNLLHDNNDSAVCILRLFDPSAHKQGRADGTA